MAVLLQVIEKIQKNQEIAWQITKWNVGKPLPIQIIYTILKWTCSTNIQNNIQIM